MSSLHRFFHVCAIAPLGLAACAPASGEIWSQATEAIDADNGTSLNGTSLNGRSLNGRSLNGRSLNGVSLGGARVADAALGSVWLEGTVLHGWNAKGHALAGNDFVGATFTATLDDQTSLTVRIDAITPSPTQTDVRFYAVSFAADGGRAPLCTDEEGATTTAIPLMGRWSYAQGVLGGGAWIDDPTAFTFACRDHALAKCVELGYEPWDSVEVTLPGGHGKVGVALGDYHQACTRLIRADYCGDGISHTVDGTLINLYDAIGVQADTESWAFEAEWGPGGARCAARQRQLAAPLPSCWATLQESNCGAPSHFGSATLLMDEDAPVE